MSNNNDLFLSNEEINELNFFETLYYVQTLNQINKTLTTNHKEENNE